LSIFAIIPFPNSYHLCFRRACSCFPIVAVATADTELLVHSPAPNVTLLETFVFSILIDLLAWHLPLPWPLFPFEHIPWLQLKNISQKSV
jgi:hypothetical protein